MAKNLNSRAAAAQLSWKIIDKGTSLDAALGGYFDSVELSPQDRGFIQELVYGVCRFYGELDHLASGLLKTPIRNKDRVVHFVLLIGIYQLRFLQTAQHAAVAETVAACKQLNKVWAKNLINGCLRNYLRNDQTQKSLEQEQSPPVDHARNHPAWIVEQINQAWPTHVADILAANDQRPPMCLRVNQIKIARDDYLQQLLGANIECRADPYSKVGIVLQQAVSVTQLPGFADGLCSVQDTAAQLAADLLDVRGGMSVLDACAAPGGKSAHILEACDNQATLQALDIAENRCEQLHATLARLDLDAQVHTADASLEPTWPLIDGGYDRILIDAPCSGLGVIRRHPDIKQHRRASDIIALQKTQAALLKNLWTYLKPGGLMLYMTCSVLPAENEQQVSQFVASQNDAMLKPINHPNALNLEHGVQTLPGVHDMDGFYYCLLSKI